MLLLWTLSSREPQTAQVTVFTCESCVCWASNTLSSHSLCVCAQVVNMTRAAEVVGAETDLELAGRKGLKKLSSCLAVFSLYFTHNTDAKNRGDWIQRHTINRGVWTFISFASLCWCSCLILVFVSFSWRVGAFSSRLFLIFCFSSFFCFWVAFCNCCVFCLLSLQIWWCHFQPTGEQWMSVLCSIWGACSSL